MDAGVAGSRNHRSARGSLIIAAPLGPPASHRGPCARVVFSTARTGEQRDPPTPWMELLCVLLAGPSPARDRLACWCLADYDALAVAVGAALTASRPSLGATPPFALWTGFDVDAEDTPVAAPVDLPSRRARALSTPFALHPTLSIGTAMDRAERRRRAFGALLLHQVDDLGSAVTAPHQRRNRRRPARPSPG